MCVIQEKLDEQGLDQKTVSVKAFDGDRGKPDDKYGKLKYGKQKLCMRDVHNLAKVLGLPVPGVMFEVYEAYKSGKYQYDIQKQFGLSPPNRPSVNEPTKVA